MKKIHSGITLHILIFLTLCFVFLAWGIQSFQEQPKAQDGILDLSQWDFDSEDRITLSGEWKFHWEKFLTWEDINSNSNLDSNLESFSAPVPQVWNRYQRNGEHLPGFGYATYHLKVKAADTKIPLSLRISSVSTAYQCYINDVLVAQNGKISTSPKGSEPFYKPVSAVFLPPARDFDIIVHVSNYTYARGGMWFDIDFGTAEQIRQYDSFLRYKDGFVIGVLAVMTIYFLFALFMMKERRKNFSFMLMCIILMIRTTLYGDSLIVQLFPEISFRLMVWISYLTLIWFPVILYHMIENFLYRPENRLLGKLFYSYAFIMSALTGLLPISLYTQWITAIDFLAILIFTTALANAFLAHLKRVPGSNIILFGSLLVGITGLHDILYQANVIPSHAGELTPIGLILFMLLLFFFMVSSYAQTYRQVQSLSSELSARLKLEQDLKEKLYALDKLKDEFLTNTSHELRTPLNGIIHITQSLLQGIGGQINQIQYQNLEVVMDSAKKLHSLIDNLLDVSLLRSGGIRILPAALDIQTLVSNMLVVFEYLKKNQGIVLNSQIPADFPLILADEIKLRQILNNLLGNALKFTESGEITIGASHDGQWARIYIADSGIGIAPDNLEGIFSTFEQVEGSIQPKYGGRGFGLYITRQLIELHGGKIWITSELGKGTQVFFTLPLSEEQPIKKESAFPSEESAFPSEETISGTTGFLELEFGKMESPYHILAVDDDPASLKALMNALQLANYHVKGVNNGKEVLRIIENGARFELIILDVMMPELSGFEVLEALRKKYGRLEIPVLMLTSKLQTEDMSLCLKLGANDYLSKPFEVDELLARVNSLVRLKTAVNKLISTEMSFLQAQIKPHFIQNALSVISSLSIKDPQKAKALILDLSDYLRGSFELNSEEGLTTLSKELEIVRAYLSIEQARFKERLQVHYHLLEDVDCTLPLLTIQPLVENAIRHGILCRLEGGEIHISTLLVPDRIRIEVRDNGVGIEPSRIVKFFELKQDQKGVGMANVHRRLIAHYGEGLHIESLPGQGTTIYFYTPYISEKEIPDENTDC